MDLLDAIHSRRSVRRFTNKSVSDDVLLGALDAALWAPSAGNVQDKQFIFVRDDKTKLEIASACFDQVWLAKVPIIILTVSDVGKMALKFKERAEFYSIIGIGAALENMLLYLVSKGLQGTHVGLFDEIKIKRLLHVPDNMRIFSIVAAGYPAEVPPVPLRADLKQITFIESYDTKWIKDRPHATYMH